MALTTAAGVACLLLIIHRARQREAVPQWSDVAASNASAGVRIGGTQVRQDLALPSSSKPGSPDFSAPLAGPASPSVVLPVRPFEQYSGQHSGRPELAESFESEAVDKEWAPLITDTLSVRLASMPERAVMQDIDLECRSTLCRLVIKGDATILASAKAANNVQPALVQQFGQPPLSTEFDDQIMFVDVDPSTGMVTIRVYVHRRPHAPSEP